MAPETNWFHDLTTEDAKEERVTLAQRLIAWLGVVCLIVLVSLATNAHAGPRFQVVADGAKVVLHDDKCAVSAVANLPYKATWEEKGKVFQGCWGARPDAGVVVFYFDDKSVGIIPIAELTAVVGV
jgi:hypothetical protein